MKEADSTPAFLFDLDGTLIDSVYQHTLAWREALEAMGMFLPNWRVHRQIGLGGSLLARALAREVGRKLSDKEVEQAQKLHGEAYQKRTNELRVTPGARELLDGLSELKVRWAIATSSKRDKAEHSLSMLHLGEDDCIVTRDDVEKAKPSPDLFLAAARRLDAELENCVVIGDSVWDLLAARRARAIGIGLLCGGYSEGELTDAGAYRVYNDPADLLAHLHDVGLVPPSSDDHSKT
ncbi:MAG: HAD family hydrolase [Acidobacteriales bacterium]|nr:HAD family hydrolase [Terriglobales bacterium]